MFIFLSKKNIALFLFLSVTELLRVIFLPYFDILIFLWRFSLFLLSFKMHDLLEPES